MQNDYFNKNEELEDFLRDLQSYVDNPAVYRKEGNEIPDFSVPFTEEEKTAFINEYTDAVNSYNKVLPDDMKIELDLEGIKAKINDPKQVEMYRRTNFVNEKLDEKHDTLYKYYAEMGTEHNNKLPLTRTLHMLIRTDKTDEADEYNKNLIKFYHKYPSEVSQAVLTTLLNADSYIYESMLQDDYERSKDYTDYFEISKLAFDSGYIISHMANKNGRISELENSQLLNFLEAQQNLGAGFNSTEMFALPTLNEKQYGVIMSHSQDENVKEYVNMLSRNYFDLSKDSTKAEIELAKKHGILDDKTPALSFKAIEIKNGKEKEIKLTEALKSNDPNIKIVKRSEEEKKNMLYITKDLRERSILRNFGIEFMGSYCRKTNNKDLEKFDQSKILDYHKGGFFERLFNTTSKEYKEFVNNFKKFTDPNNPDLSVKDKLIASAKAYMEHKNVHNKVDLVFLNDATGKERVNFCMSVLDAFKDIQDETKLLDYDASNNSIDSLEKKDNIVRTKVSGLENDVNIEKNDITKKVDNNTINKTITVETEKQV